jgi:hypothetical protein
MSGTTGKAPAVAVSKFVDKRWKTQQMRSLRKNATIRNAQTQPVQSASAATNTGTGASKKSHTIVTSSPPAARVEQVSPLVIEIRNEMKHAANELKEVPGTYLHYDDKAYRAKGISSIERRPLPFPAELQEKALVSPRQRLEVLKVESSHSKAAKLLRQYAGQQATKLKQMRNRYPQGMEKFDSPSNPDSVVYQDIAEQYIKKTERKAAAAAARRALIEKNECRPAQDGKTRGRNHDTVPDMTYNKTFKRVLHRDEVNRDTAIKARAQRKRDLELRNRTYDVLGLDVQTCPPSGAPLFEDCVPRDDAGHPKQGKSNPDIPEFGPRVYRPRKKLNKQRRELEFRSGDRIFPANDDAPPPIVAKKSWRRAAAPAPFARQDSKHAMHSKIVLKPLRHKKISQANTPRKSDIFHLEQPKKQPNMSKRAARTLRMQRGGRAYDVFGNQFN